MSITRKCNVEGCTSKYSAKGYCQPHYWKNYKYGDPEYIHPKRTRTTHRCKYGRCSVTKGKVHGYCRRHLNRARWKYSVELLGGKCVKCGSTQNLEFDHIKESRNGDKTRLISQLLRGSIARLNQELSLCQLLCMSCHGIKTTTVDLGIERAVHGSPSMYTNHNCRCSKCRKAWAIYYHKKYRMV